MKFPILGRMAAILCAAIIATTAQAAETQTYRYDAKGRLVRVERSGTVNSGVITEHSHDKADNRTRLKTTGSANPPP
jgi:YD repeat-containing protein